MPQTVQGKLHVAKEARESLGVSNDFWSPSNFSIEVWEAVCLDVVDQKKSSDITTQVYATKQIEGVSSTLKFSPELIEFSITGIPIKSQLLLFFGFRSLPSTTTSQALSKHVHIVGLANRKFATNYMPKNFSSKDFGIIAVKPGEVDVGQRELFEMYGSSGNMAFSLGSVWGAIKEIGNLVWEGGAILAGHVVDRVGLIYVELYGVVQSLVLDDGVILPRFRTISSQELDWANEHIFNRTLPSSNNIIISNLLGAGKREFVFPTGYGQTVMHLGRAMYEHPVQAAPETFIHELAHVWQIENTADVKFVAKSIATQICDSLPPSLGGSDQYKYTPGGNWSDYNFEQQARIVQSCYRDRVRGINTSWEQQMVEQNIRKGVPFPPVRTSACIAHLKLMAEKRKELNKRKDELKLAVLADMGETAVRHSDGSIKVGSEKGVSSVNLSAQDLTTDAIYQKLKAEYDVLEAQRIAMNCA